MEKTRILSTSSPFTNIPILHGLHYYVWLLSVHSWHSGTLSCLSASLFRRQWQLTQEPVGYRVIILGGTDMHTYPESVASRAMARCTDHDERITPIDMDTRSEGGVTAAFGYTPIWVAG